MKKPLLLVIIVIALLGMMDAGYLTYEHFQNVIPPCSINIPFADCGKVLTSTYSIILGIPLALIGFIHYALFVTILIYIYETNKRYAKYIALFFSWLGFLSSIYFVYLQIAIIHSICIFCMTSALSSTLLFFLIHSAFNTEKKMLLFFLFGLHYRNLIKPLLFRIDPEKIHVEMTMLGQFFGKFRITRILTHNFFGYTNPLLRQTIGSIQFNNPIGLAAGFDYEARLTQILPSVGFGFETIGTITNHPYEGNPRPMLGRLPKSKSLMVNKGYKNLGANLTTAALQKLDFKFPLGISIGRTNKKGLVTQKQSIADIIEAFRVFEKSKIKNSYYELNISCPNLYGDISFYPPNNLKDLLTEVDKLHLSKPLFIKMPIEKNDKEILVMLHIIASHSPIGVIFGNLQKDRKNPAFDQTELKKFPVGNFSGKPTFARSNQLIKLTYKHYKKRFIIIGCGGVFSAEDAYEKITLGASLIQLITGMIFVGPQLISDINIKLIDMLDKDGFTNISEAIGSRNT